jgi:hypothetical protein
MALMYTDLEEVLLLDADSTPVRDPAFLFDDARYLATGTIFWPDYWVTPQENPIWDILGILPRSELEQESGQLLVNKATAWTALTLLQHFQSNLYYSLLNGDKDTFRFAWIASGTPYTMVPTYPAAIGQRAPDGNFCGHTMGQHDLDGDILFIHHNQIKISKVGEFSSDGKAFFGFKKEVPVHSGAVVARAVPTRGMTVQGEGKTKTTISCVDIEYAIATPGPGHFSEVKIPQAEVSGLASWETLLFKSFARTKISLTSQMRIGVVHEAILESRHLRHQRNLRMSNFKNQMITVVMLGVLIRFEKTFADLSVEEVTSVKSGVVAAAVFAADGQFTNDQIDYVELGENNSSFATVHFLPDIVQQATVEEVVLKTVNQQRFIVSATINNQAVEFVVQEFVVTTNSSIDCDWSEFEGVKGIDDLAIATFKPIESEARCLDECSKNNQCQFYSFRVDVGKCILFTDENDDNSSLDSSKVVVVESSNYNTSYRPPDNRCMAWYVNVKDCALPGSTWLASSEKKILDSKYEVEERLRDVTADTCGKACLGSDKCYFFIYTVDTQDDSTVCKFYKLKGLPQVGLSKDGKKVSTMYFPGVCKEQTPTTPESTKSPDDEPTSCDIIVEQDLSNPETITTYVQRVAEIVDKGDKYELAPAEKKHNLLACSQSCAALSKCAAFGYFTPASLCHLYKERAVNGGFGGKGQFVEDFSNDWELFVAARHCSQDGRKPICNTNNDNSAGSSDCSPVPKEPKKDCAVGNSWIAASGQITENKYEIGRIRDHASLVGCAQFCEAEDKCFYFGFNNDSLICTLYKEKGQLSIQTGFSSRVLYTHDATCTNSIETTAQSTTETSCSVGRHWSILDGQTGQNKYIQIVYTATSINQCADDCAAKNSANLVPWYAWTADDIAERPCGMFTFERSSAQCTLFKAKGVKAALLKDEDRTDAETHVWDPTCAPNSEPQCHAVAAGYKNEAGMAPTFVGKYAVAPSYSGTINDCAEGCESNDKCFYFGHIASSQAPNLDADASGQCTLLKEKGADKLVPDSSTKYTVWVPGECAGADTSNAFQAEQQRDFGSAPTTNATGSGRTSAIVAMGGAILLIASVFVAYLKKHKQLPEEVQELDWDIQDLDNM